MNFSNIVKFKTIIDYILISSTNFNFDAVTNFFVSKGNKIIFDNFLIKNKLIIFSKSAIDFKKFKFVFETFLLSKDKSNFYDWYPSCKKTVSINNEVVAANKIILWYRKMKISNIIIRLMKEYSSSGKRKFVF